MNISIIRHEIKTALLLGVVIVTANACYRDKQAVLPPATLAGQKNLEDQENIYARLLGKEWASPEGLVYCLVIYGTNKRITQDDILKTAPDPAKLDAYDLKYDDEVLMPVINNGKPQYLLQGIPLEDVESYEDANRSTASYLSGLCFKYLVTQKPEVLENAHKVFRSLYSVYQLGLQEQRGWIPKPYGFKCTKQSSMDNQAEYYIALMRYYKIAPENDRQLIRQVLTDMMDYWLRNKYKMHVDYFGLTVDYAGNRFYPGHWPLLFLPLAYFTWEITGAEKYHQAYNDLLNKLDISPGADPEYLRVKVRALHRWLVQYSILLEIGAPPKELWLKGLDMQRQAMALQGPGYERTFIFSLWLDNAADSAKHMQWVKDNLFAHGLKDYRYGWRRDYRIPKTLGFRERSIYTLNPAMWFETYWHGRYLEKW